MKQLYDLWDKYSNEMSVELDSGISNGKKQITIITIKRWLKDNGYEDWIEGKKFEQINKYNEEKMNETGYEILKDFGDTCLVSFEKIIKEVEEEEKQNFNKNRIVKGGYTSKQKSIQLYKNYLKNK